MILPFKLGLGGKIGSGKQKFSWIDIKDVINIYKFVIDNEIEGILNISSPNSVTNYEFTKTLGKVLNRPTILPMPEFMLKLLFGEASIVLLSNQDMKPKRLLNLGYNFEYFDLEKSLRSLV
jgi:NAD dependent epimerase/dehydratase family enzyme